MFWPSVHLLCWFTFHWVENPDISALAKFVDESKQLLPAAQPGKVLTMTTELIAEGLTDSSH